MSLPNRQDCTAQLPDEILDSIIWSTGPRYATAVTRTIYPEKRNWLSCASVCRRWHRITLPHSFRYLRVMETNYMNDYSERTASNFYLFLQENPPIANLVQEVNFIRVAANMKVFCSILDALPNLQCLALHDSIVDAELEVGLDTCRARTTSRTLDKLVYWSGACEVIDCTPEVCGMQLPQLLSLFSEVGEFEAHGGCSNEHEIPSKLEGVAPQIHSFNTISDLEYYHTLRRLGLFDHLTCLQLTLSQFSRVGPYGNEFLNAVGRTQTLRELRLSYTQRVDERSFNLGSQLPATMANLVRDGLVACSGSLHGFRLDMKTWITRARLTTEENARRIFHLGFLIGLEIIALLDVDQIQHVSFRYFVGCAHHCRPQDIRGLDWARLRDICRRIVDLRSFNLDIFDKEAQKDHFRACAHDEMKQLEPEFRDVMTYGEPRDFFRCDDPTCAWYSGKRLNSYITVHDILKGR
ncbi:hypothetical protein BDY19DRAFT_971279 [Irpex rosettiformis]|uniref:Uncharacterized protein n=1 Tax=Irpex rosettiformis TaxID=378272 RepID=A0ACB8TR96_9APHY|nr:hypothetical protein BDY19DRAFT_971279 [Irpex rosettiformis]